MDSVPPASRFLSTLSLRRATRLFLEIYTLFKNFYPRSPCGERPHGRAAAGCGIHISIHALLAESDDAYLAALGKGVQISIHALLAESDYPKQENYPQSNISIHALLAESDPIMRKYCPSTKISIHALLAESDSKPRRLKSRRCVFLSTLSLRRATIFALLTVPGLRLFLSTLSLRRATVAPPLQFNDTSKFLSTLSLRRATLYKLSCQGTPEFLSTLSLRRATGLTAPAAWQHRKFLSTLSLRRATNIPLPNAHVISISIHALLAESD